MLSPFGWSLNACLHARVCVFRWDDDVVFKNCARGEVDKKERRFINDTLRSDFHKKFMEKYIKWIQTEQTLRKKNRQFDCLLYIDLCTPKNECATFCTLLPSLIATCWIHQEIRKSLHSQGCKYRCWQCFCVLWFWPLNFRPKINGFPGLAVEHFFVMFGDHSCIGFWDIAQKTDRQIEVKSQLPNCHWHG